ncbi:MAG: hypothetical protein K2M12_08135 [Muribaculaceae bacterium]|nr:hypothetical protein [Muribaculaceae bacterium]
MYPLFLRLLSVVSAIILAWNCSYADPGTAQPHIRFYTAASDSTFFRRDANSQQNMRLPCDSSCEDETTARLKSLMGRELGNDYYVGVTAGRAWRPLQSYGDCDCKIRVYDPTVGLSVKYSF